MSLSSIDLCQDYVFCQERGIFRGNHHYNNIIQIKQQDYRKIYRERKRKGKFPKIFLFFFKNYMHIFRLHLILSNRRFLK